ncbi:Membrane-bound lytic murein transglycosylase B precursor [Rhodovulum sp. PH10]|uniref:lytic murein transglycosylase n=1 Tax=Rhodovulum sp. PH10 TaxID=1187851 RepID=UPI00027C247A|nr:lytic murein transglycosylase [Rhodovulum sp. PH10]EJW13385.1 Membrane-bound lytic murein transglycosylase B precursor [Rhodovulum sp. PH10]
MTRKNLLCTAVLLLAAVVWLGAAVAPAAAADAAFRQWLDSLWPDAQKLGVSRKTFETAIRGLEPDLSLPDLRVPGRAEKPPRGQAEFVQTPEQYLRERTLANLAGQGKRLYRQHRDTLAAIETRYGVPASVVLAIWGRETSFGNYRLPHDALQVLATQGFYGKRADYFRNEFLYAMKMLEDGHVARGDMRSSWGGAMGMTQFLPSEYYQHAVDFDGNGHPDIWHSVPDALASAAEQLAHKHWQPGHQWAYEVKVPASLDCTIADPDHKRPLRAWLADGYRPVGKEPQKADLGEEASLLMPAGLYGPAFLILRNYYVIKDYNFSDLYVLFVGNVADRIAGGGPFTTPWEKVVQLHSRDLEEMQRHLAALGLYDDKIDGKAGMRTRLAVGAYQKANGLKRDCWPTAAVLDHMRGKAARR